MLGLGYLKSLLAFKIINFIFIYLFRQNIFWNCNIRFVLVINHNKNNYSYCNIFYIVDSVEMQFPLLYYLMLCNVCCISLVCIEKLV